MPVFKLDSNRVPDFWDLVKPGLMLGRNISGIEGDWDFANSVLEHAISEHCQIWLGFEAGEPTGDGYVGFVITHLNVDWFSKSKDLVLYFAYLYKTASDRLRTDAAMAFSKYARGLGCTRIVAYTDNAAMEKLINSFFGSHIKKRQLYYVNMEDF